MHEFRGRTAVVTGAASGIGRGLAERFAQDGMNVVLADVEERALANAVSAISARGQRAIGVVTNVMERASLDALLARATAEFGRVHVLCNNASVLGAAEGARAVWELTSADWDWVLGVNFYGVLYGLQAFVPHMLEHGEPGHIVNTASVVAYLPGGGPYGVSKSGVLALSDQDTDLTWALLWVLLGLVVLETFMSRWFSHATDHDRPTIVGRLVGALHGGDSSSATTDSKPVSKAGAA